MRALGTLAIAVAAFGCRFDPAGVAPDDQPGDDGGGAVDSAVLPPDASHDADHDGVLDDDDDCPSIANPEQYDEDGDKVGDACDDCPHVANLDQATTDGDAVGDACDPHPGQPGDAIVLFDGFNGVSRPAAWTASSGADTWSVSGGKLHQTATTREEKILHYEGFAAVTATIDVAVSPTTIPISTDSNDSDRTAGVVLDYSPGGGWGREAVVEDRILSVTYPAYALTQDLGGSANNNNWTYLGAALSTGRYVIRTILDPDQESVWVTEPGGNEVKANEATTAFDGAIGLLTKNVAADFEYIVVFSYTP